MKNVLGGCLLLMGILVLGRTLYQRFFENAWNIPWYWWAGGAACVLLGIRMLWQRE